MTEEEAKAAISEDAKYIYEVRSKLPEDLMEMTNSWLKQLSEYGNRERLKPHEAACAVACLMAMVMQAHVDSAMSDGVDEFQAADNILRYFDMAARIELGILRWINLQKPRN